MTESSVLELLLKSNVDTNSSPHQPHFPKLLVDCVEHISKNITDVLYDSLASKSGLQDSKRTNILILLRKWCIGGGRHFRIDSDNYNCLIDVLLGNSNFHAADPDENLQLVINSDYFPKSTVSESVIQYYKKLEEIQVKKEKLLGNIIVRDRKKCGSINFCLNIPKHTELSTGIHTLELLNKQKSCHLTIANGKGDDCPAIKSEEISREKQIGCAYALLNLNKTSNDIALVSEILKSLKHYESLEANEIEFIDYLWQNWAKLDIPLEIPALLLEYFSFIYEKDFIIMCTDALKNNTVAVSDSVRTILEISSKNERLHSNLLSLLYELYTCSGYDNRLCKVLILIP